MKLKSLFLLSAVAMMLAGTSGASAQTPRPEYPRPQFERAD